MPNWCDNKLEVTGPADKLKAFAKKANGHTSNFNNFYGEEWESLDDIRIAAIASNMPEPGDVSSFSFHALHPVPELICRLGYDDSVAKKSAEALGIEYPGYGGYGWQTNNWGTKWEPDVAYVEISDDYLVYDFYTAWCPPIALIRHLAKEWPELTFDITYKEYGMSFQGEASFSNGECVYEEEWEMSENEDEDEGGE